MHTCTKIFCLLHWTYFTTLWFAGFTIILLSKSSRTELDQFPNALFVNVFFRISFRKFAIAQSSKFDIHSFPQNIPTERVGMSGKEWKREKKKHSEYTKHNENKETWLISNIKRMKLHSCVSMLSTIWIAGHWFLSGQSSPENQSTLIHPKGKYVLIIFQSAHTKKDKSILVRENSWTRKRANC